MAGMKISRRTCLRGIGGVTLALPPLEAMLNQNGTAHADGSPLPKRYVACFGGYSLGCGHDPGPELFTPSQTGPNYDLKVGVAPFGDSQTGFANKDPVQGEISIVSGLLIPTLTQKQTDSGDTPAPGGKPANHHGYMMSPLLTGNRSYLNNAGPGGPSSDQIVADKNGTATAIPSLQYAIQATDYLSRSSVAGISVRRAGGAYSSMTPQDKPSGAWRKMFESGFNPSPEAGAAAAKQFTMLQKQRRSVLDMVLFPGRVARLRNRVSAADRAVLEEHFDKLRTLEKQLDTLGPSQLASCHKLASPGDDPKIGEGYLVDGAHLPITETNYYSNEELRAQLYMDYTHMALACDRTRVVSIVFTSPQSDMNMWPLLGPKKLLRTPIGVHGCTHGPDGFGLQTECAAMIAWHMKHFAGLVARLRDTPEGSGSVLDNTVLLFLSEGGCGYSEENNDGTYLLHDAHSTHNMAVVVAGGRNLGLKPGRHIKAFEKHPAQVLISAMNAAGVQQDTLGEVKGGIPELFS